MRAVEAARFAVYGERMSGYEKSPDYGNPPRLTWQQWAKGGLVIAAVVAFMAWAVLR